MIVGRPIMISYGISRIFACKCLSVSSTCCSSLKYLNPKSFTVPLLSKHTPLTAVQIRSVLTVGVDVTVGVGVGVGVVPGGKSSVVAFALPG